MLGTQPFAICINDLDEEIKYMVAKFADDTKIGRKVSCEKNVGGYKGIWSEWAKFWKMKYNMGK